MGKLRTSVITSVHIRSLRTGEEEEKKKKTELEEEESWFLFSTQEVELES